MELKPVREFDTVEEAAKWIKAGLKTKKILETLIRIEKITLLEQLMNNLEVWIASDEEWTTVYSKFKILVDLHGYRHPKRPTIYGLKGSELTE